MSFFVIACAVITALTINSEPQYVRFVPAEQNTENSHTVDIVPININTATLEELQTLAGIGEVRAQNIIAYREEHGGFLYIEELTQVSGIGSALFESIKNFITVQ